MVEEFKPGNISENMRMSIKRVGTSQILRYFYLPISFPNIKCLTSKEFGQGDYEVDCSALGREQPVIITILNNNRKCPFINHCEDS